MKRAAASISLAKRAYTEIRNGILSGELPLGAPISRLTLAQDLGMSVVPVSDALQRLETEGLVESWPRVGTRFLAFISTTHQQRKAVRQGA